jgi:hypothetical protein
VELSHNPSVEPVATAANAGRCEIAGVADHLTPLLDSCIRLFVMC